jgi:hypothetical protein
VNNTETKGELRSLLERIASSEAVDDAYTLASDAWKYSMSRVELEGDWIFHPMWLLWGGLTDWAELKPEEAQDAAISMRRAASEFLAIDPADEPAQRAYFDVWLYEELGYERPNSRS